MRPYPDLVHPRAWLACVAWFVATSALAGCASPAPRAPSPARLVPVYADTAQLRVGAQQVVNAFVAEVTRARGVPLGTAPTAHVRNTPQLIFFNGQQNQIVVPWWATAAPEMHGVFRSFAGGSDADAEYLFRAFFNGFLIAHEAGHWFQSNARQRSATLYESENMANRFAVAFWRTQPNGEALLGELERLAATAFANLQDPTPAGEDPVAYFGANYQALGREPLKYGYYQFRFMRDAIRDRSQLDFAKMVSGPPR